ncbi:hypothetical protein D8S78_21765 [Natrialba swarupiae]|nr:hypothetical protein [Natrialba swarupiae]
MLVAEGPGVATVTATYDGETDSVEMAVEADEQELDPETELDVLEATVTPTQLEAGEEATIEGRSQTSARVTANYSFHSRSAARRSRVRRSRSTRVRVRTSRSRGRSKMPVSFRSASAASTLEPSPSSRTPTRTSSSTAQI